MKYDALVYIALVAVVLVVGIAAGVIFKIDDKVDLETRKVRFAAATFTGILMLFVFTSSLYYSGDSPDAGKDIFDKGLTAMFTLAGSIVGYLFGVSGNSGNNKKDQEK